VLPVSDAGCRLGSLKSCLVENVYGTNQLEDSRKQAASAACATSGFAHFLTFQILISSDLSIFLCHPFEKEELLMLSILC
jgi:hypothetical protein